LAARRSHRRAAAATNWPPLPPPLCRMPPRRIFRPECVEKLLYISLQTNAEQVISVSYYYADISEVTNEVFGWIESARADSSSFSPEHGYFDGMDPHDGGLHRCTHAHDGFFQFAYEFDKFAYDHDKFSDAYKRGRAVATSIFTKMPLRQNAIIHATISSRFDYEISR
jgi:hypothetical protein